MQVAIDCGHGLYTAGKRIADEYIIRDDKLTGREWYLNNRVGKYLAQILVAYGDDVLRVDDPTGQTDVPLSKRCITANTWGANIYISIHHNAGINHKTGGGTEVYFYPANSQRETDANTLYRHVVAANNNRGNRSQKVIPNKNLAVLNGTAMPAFLVECGFMDGDERELIQTDKFAYQTARGIAEFIVGTSILDKYAIIAENSRPSEKCLCSQCESRGFCTLYREEAAT